ncbi:hypothetical protein TNCV_3909501 [Trichonephila clavipes]|nr:hypothetical protein TNCV_3909501 [Trichonephila clavipes]
MEHLSIFSRSVSETAEWRRVGGAEGAMTSGGIRKGVVASGNRYCDPQNYLKTEGLNIHQCAKKIRALQTILEAKREEFVDDTLI